MKCIVLDMAMQFLCLEKTLIGKNEYIIFFACVIHSIEGNLLNKLRMVRQLSDISNCREINPYK